jgi:hypothetical protein
MVGSWAQHLDTAITTTPKTPPTVQNVNSILIIFCNFTVDLRPNRFSCQEARQTRLLSRNIYVATNQHGSRTHQRASHKHFYYHTHTVTSALKVAYLQTYRTNHRSLYRRGPTRSLFAVLSLLQTSDYCQTEAEEGQNRPNKSQIQNDYYNYEYGVTAGSCR